MQRRIVNAGIVVDTPFYDQVVAPFFQALRWKARRHTDPPEGATIIMEVGEEKTGPEVFIDPAIIRETVGILDALSEGRQADPNAGLPGWVDLRKPGSVYQKQDDWRVASEIPDSIRLKAAENEGREPVKDLFDLQAIRADPEQNALLVEYQEQPLKLKAKDMVDVGKEAFLAKGWVYTGEHYGDGSLIIQTVLDSEDKVVPRPAVVSLLRDLNILVGEDLQVADLDHDLEAGEAAESSFFAGVQVPLSQEEEERLAEAAPGAHGEEEDKLPPASLVLAEGQIFGIKAGLLAQSGRFDVDIKIGDNIVSVDCDPRQGLDFFRDCASIISNLLDRNVEDDQEKETK